MNPIRRHSVAEEAAARIEAAVQDGTLSGVIPGSRELCPLLAVSPASLRQALQRLVTQGLLRQAGGNRRYEVVPAGERTDRPQRLRKLWIMEPIERAQPSGLPVEMLKHLEGRLARKGWTCEWSMEIADERRSHRKRWNKLLQARDPDALLLVGPHRRTVEWAADCGVPVCCFGGDPAGLPVASLAFDTTHMLETALSELMALGHRDIFLPLTVRTPGFVDRVHATMTEVLAREGVVFSREWHSPLTDDYSPEALAELIERRLAKRVPTAMLSFGSSILTMMGVLQKYGHRVPGQISLVNLGGYHDIEWLRPRVAHFDFEWSKAAHLIERWLGNGMERQGRWRICPTWVPGETIAARAG